MNKVNAQDRINKLRDLINDYRYHYHVLNESIMSEDAADSLKHELAKLEAEYPDLVTPESPTQRISGTVLSGFTPVEHVSRMLSLNDVFNEAEILAWLDRISKSLKTSDFDLFIDIKMDGLACSLIYEDGVLVRGVTRGDGYVGEDVTLNIKTIESIPLILRPTNKYSEFLKGRTEVRGEIVMYKDDFEALNKKRHQANQPLFANPRNTAAGTIRQLDPKLVAERKLYFRAYDLIRSDAAEISTNDFAYVMLKELGFLTNSDARIVNGIDQIMSFVKKWEDKRLTLEFNTDGLVVKINDRLVFESLGIAGKAPRGAIAYKYAAEQTTTIVKDIFVSIGRTGVATPVAILDPVVIAGSTVQMATLHNEDEVKKKDIRIGDSVILQKAGDIIPEVVEVLPQLRNGSEKIFIMPIKCPDCGTKLVKLKAIDVAWRCPNIACPSRTWKRIQHYASKEALDIEGLGEKNVVALLDAGLIKDIADIYSLTPYMLLSLDRFGEISANKLIKSIQSKKEPSLDKFLYALGIRHIGVQTALDLAKKFKTFENVMAATVEDLVAVEGIGEVVGDAVVEYFSDPINQRLLNKFKRQKVWPLPMKQYKGKLEAKNFVVTGTLTSMSRDEAAKKIRSMGGNFHTSITKDTDYLVIGDKPGNSKVIKARNQNIVTLSEREFISLLD